MRRVLMCGGAGLSLVSLVGGCWGGDPEPVVSESVEEYTPVPVPTPTPTEKSPEELAAEQARAIKQADIEAAEQTMRDYFEIGNRVLNDHYQGWEELQRFWGTAELIDAQSYSYRYYQEIGDYSVGGAVIRSMTATDYVADETDPANPVWAQVKLTVCSDASGVTHYSADRTEIPKTAERILSERVLERQQVGGAWMIISETFLEGAPC